MTMAKLLVYATGLFFILYGAAFTLLPVHMASLITGAVPGTPSGLIDLRATYGGMSIAIGATLFLLGSRSELISLGLLATAVVLLAMAGTRLLGIMIDGTPNGVMYLYLAAELVFGGLALYLRGSAPGDGDA